MSKIPEPILGHSVTISVILITMLAVIIGTKLKLLRYSEWGSIWRGFMFLVAPLCIVIADSAPNAPFVAMVFMITVFTRGILGRSEPAPVEPSPAE